MFEFEKLLKMFFSSIHLVLILVYIDVSICVRKVFVFGEHLKIFLSSPTSSPSYIWR